MFAIYPDGRVTGTNGVEKVEKQVAPADVEQLLTTINGEYQWFTAEIFSTYLAPCKQCYAHLVTVSYNGQEKTVTGVDGTTAAPPGFGFTLAHIRPLLPAFNSASPAAP
jgi:hypothetical protein